MNKIKTSLKSIDRNTTTLFGIIVIIFAIMSILAPKTFLSITNLQGMGIQFAEFGILAMGMMLAMISGGIDLSLVGIANLSGIVASVVMIQLGGSNSSIIVGILAALVVGALCGSFNGFLIGYMQIPPMLVTLCGLQLYTGLCLLITRGPAITGLPPAFSFIANGTLLGMPIALVIFILVVAFAGFLLNSTIYGQNVRFMGTNSTASKYSGINNLKATMFTYGISGIFGGIGGVIMASHYNSAKSDYGTSYTLLTLLIVVLGGTNPNGGYGKVSGVALSIIVLQLISSAFNLLRVNSFIKTFVWGILLLAIMIRAGISEKKQLAKQEG